MNPVLKALSRAIAHYPHTLAGIASDIGKDKEVLRKELGPGSNHKLSVSDAIAIAASCCEARTEHCYDFAAYVAEECGGKFVLNEEDFEPEQSPMRRVSVLAREAGDVTAVFIEALQDGIVSDNELAAIELEIAQAEEALRKLRKAARAVNAAGKPAAERLVLPVRHMRDEPVITERVTTTVMADGVRMETRETFKEPA